MKIFGYGEQAMEAARRETKQDVIDRFLNGVRCHRGHDKGREVLIELIRKLRIRGLTPWGSELAGELVELVDHLMETKNDLERNLKNERYQREQLEWELEDYQRDPLQKQVRELTTERDQWRDETLHLRGRVQKLERGLERCQTRYQNETQRLQNRVDELNIIIAEQEQRLNAFRN
jgi:chromosome segregation ATPase